MRRAAYLGLSLAILGFLALSCSSFALAGCNNSCFAFTWNSGGATGTVKVSNPPPTCSLSAASGAVRLEIGSESEAGRGGGKVPHVEHLFITLAGIDVHASALADDDSEGWQPLAVELAEHPRQVDLLADLRANRSFAPIPDVVLPSALYAQVRLRLATPLTDGLVLETDDCGAGALHCAVMSDGRIEPLLFGRSRPSFRIPSDSLHGDYWLYIPPDSRVTLVIALDPERCFLRPLAERFTLAPVFHLRVERPERIPED